MAEAATVQDGSNEYVPDSAALDIVNLTRIKSAQERYASENGSLRSTFAKAEVQGLHLAAAKRALKVIKSDKQAEMIEEMQKTLYYLKLLGRGVDKKDIDLFDYASSLAPLDEKAADDGRRAGLAGEAEASMQYDIGSLAGQAWLAAYRQGTAERDLIMSMPSPETDEDDED